jgi:hypothetical protein
MRNGIWDLDPVHLMKFDFGPGQINFAALRQAQADPEPSFEDLFPHF